MERSSIFYFASDNIESGINHSFFVSFCIFIVMLRVTDLGMPNIGWECKTLLLIFVKGCHRKIGVRVSENGTGVHIVRDSSFPVTPVKSTG